MRRGLRSKVLAVALAVLTVMLTVGASVMLGGSPSTASHTPSAWWPTWSWTWTWTRTTTTVKPTTTTSRPTTTTVTTAPPTTSPPPVNAAGRPQSFWLHMNSTPASDAMLVAEAKRRGYIVLNGWEKPYIPKLKAANPNIKVFVYKDLSSSRSYACGDAEIPAGVDYCDADRNHPDWFLTSPTGSRYTYSGYSGHYQMDIGNTAYQNAWATNVINSAREFDGIFADNALFACDTYHSGSCPSRYPDNASFQNAYVSMLSNLYPKLQGKLIVANLSNARLYGNVWDRYTTHTDGGFDEWWLAFSSTNVMPDYAEGWSKQVAEVASNEARGKITWVQPHFDNGDTKTFRYTLASYLMANGGKSAYSHIQQTDGYGNPSPWHPEYDWNLGAAAGAYRSVGDRVFRRDFSCGAALVSAHPSSTVTVQLGDTYTNENGGAVTSVTLTAKSGAVLRKNC